MECRSTEKTQLYEADLLSELSFGVYDQLAPLVTDALLELHNGLVRLPPIPGAVHLVSLAIRTVARVFFNQTDLQSQGPSVGRHDGGLHKSGCAHVRQADSTFLL